MKQRHHVHYNAGQLDRYDRRHRKLTIDVIFSQFPRLDHRKRANNETPEGIWHDLFLAARSRSVQDKRVVIQPM